MKIVDTFEAKGSVTPYFLNIKTGEKLPFGERHNTLSYDASKAMAMAFGGDTSLIPNRIGIVFGEENAGIDSGAIERTQDWNTFLTTLESHNCDVQIRPFCYSPTFSIVTEKEQEVEVTKQAVTFHSHSDSVTGGARGTEAANLGKTIYQAVLLNEDTDKCSTSGTKYTIIARVSLKTASSTYRTKPNEFEIALDWTVKFR